MLPPYSLVVLCLSAASFPKQVPLLPRGLSEGKAGCKCSGVIVSQGSPALVTVESRRINTPASSPLGRGNLKCIQLCLPEFPHRTEPHLPTAGNCLRAPFVDRPPFPVLHAHAPTGGLWDHHTPNKLFELKSLFPSLPLGRGTPLKTGGPRRVVESNTVILGFWNLILH